MEENHKETIRRNYTFLIGNMMPESVMDFLLQENVITPYMKEDIEVCRTRRDKIVKMIDILIRRGPSAFNVFIDALRNTDQEFVAQKLLSNLQNDQNQNVLQELNI